MIQKSKVFNNSWRIRRREIKKMVTIQDKASILKEIRIALTHYIIAGSKTDAFINKPYVEMLSEICEYFISEK